VGWERKQAKDAEPFQELVKPQMEKKWLNNISAALIPVNRGNWSV
jgi:hypothetical protein